MEPRRASWDEFFDFLHYPLTIFNSFALVRALCDINIAIRGDVQNSKTKLCEAGPKVIY